MMTALPPNGARGEGQMALQRSSEKCQRCGSMMSYEESTYFPEGHQWRCPMCGEVFDETIQRNRVGIRPNTGIQKGGRYGRPKNVGKYSK